ncbi:MAG TPA: pyrroline-5-carboxylate reductase [Acidiphilium sp.]
MSGVLPPLLLLGGGKMGSAMLAGWRERGISRVVIVDPGDGAAVHADERVTVVDSAGAIPADFVPEAIILAVKPQVAAGAVAPLARIAGNAVIVSIMAGKTIAWLGGQFGAGAAVVRAMPNTPAAVRMGITVACAGPAVTPDQRDLTETLLGAVGEVAFVTDEALLDPVTAVSGSGPAYVFLLAELLETAAVEQGIPADLARRLARRTVIGSGALLAASAESADALRRAVTSPKGTTEAAHSVLMDPPAWPDAVSRAVAAATLRSRDLAQG